jgi:hypothetical protein
MSKKILIVDRLVQVEDDSLSSLLEGFGNESDTNTAPGSRNQEPVCIIGRADGLSQHGVQRIQASFPISHVLTMTRDRSAVLVADDLFEHATVRAERTDGLSDALLLAVYSRLTYFRTVFVHGALMDIPGFGGVMLVGRSGVGKTTLAELCAQHGGAEIINGDKVFLALRETHPGQILAYGSPWNGSSPYRVNKRCVLRAIVDLKREDQKYIRRLDDVEALMTYMPSIYMPNWDVRLTERVMETLDAMMPLVPIYQMSCEKDRTAVDMLRTALVEGAAQSATDKGEGR